MPKFTEHYEELQGRPASKRTLDMDSRETVVVPGTNISIEYLSSVVMTYEGVVVTNKGKIVYRS